MLSHCTMCDSTNFLPNSWFYWKKWLENHQINPLYTYTRFSLSYTVSICRNCCFNQVFYYVCKCKPPEKKMSWSVIYNKFPTCCKSKLKKLVSISKIETPLPKRTLATKVVST